MSLTRSHKRTSMEPSRSCWNDTTSALQPEEITSKGPEFHVCTINKSAYTKRSGNLSHAPRIYIYIYIIYMYFHSQTVTLYQNSFI